MKENESDILKQIDAYLKGTLSSEEIDQLWVEFAKKPELLDQLELEVGVQKLIKEEINESKKAATFQLPYWTWHAAAAAVILLVFSIQLFQVDSKTSLDQFIVPSISLDQAETGDGVRAKDMVITTADSLLNLGFSALMSGNMDQALSLYDEVIALYDTEPYGSKAYTNKGIVLYNQRNYLASVESFDSALVRIQDNRMVEEKAHWYKGNALVNLDRLEEAQLSVYNAYSMDGIYRKPAFLLLKKLQYDLGDINTQEGSGGN